MAVIVETEYGEMYHLPDSIALDDHSLSVDIPGTDVIGKHGEWKFDKYKKVQPRKLNLSGTMKGIDRQEAEGLAARLRAILVGSGILKLRRDFNSEQFIYCETRDIRHNYHRGRFGASVFTINATLEALDPFWYLPKIAKTWDIENQGDQIEIDHPGTVDSEQPIIRIMAKDKLIDPCLTNLTSGIVLCYHGEIEAGKTLELNGNNLKAGTSKLDKMIPLFGVVDGGKPDPVNMGAEWFINGFPIMIGENILIYTDDEESTGKAIITIEFDPRNW